MRSEKGSILIWFAVLIPILLVLAGYSYFNNQVSLASAKLQAAADAAVVSASSRLCSSNKCYEESWDSAFATIKQNLSSYIPGLKDVDFRAEYNKFIQNDPDNPSKYSEISESNEGFTEYIARWHFPDINFTAEINRTFAFYDDSGSIISESLEGLWQKDNPGVAKYVIANSVEINLKARPNLGFIDGIYNLQDNFGIVSKSSLARVEPVARDVPVAPFALPICALTEAVLDVGQNVISSEIQDPATLCMADRIFANSKRYCSDSDPNCEIVPGFIWDPAEVAILDETNNKIWNSPRFSERSNHFGVVGVPEKYIKNLDVLADPDGAEASLRLLLESGGSILASIGHKFKILPDSFRDPLTEDALWNKILVNYVGADTDTNPAFTSTELQDYDWNFKRTSNVKLPQMEGTMDDILNSAGQWTPDHGTCNSRRFYIPGERNSSMHSFALDPENLHFQDYVHKLATFQGFALSRMTTYFPGFLSDPTAANFNSLSSTTNFFYFVALFAEMTAPDYLTAFGSSGVYKMFRDDVRIKSGGSPENGSVWKVKVPVIAEFGANALACRGDKSSSGDLSLADPLIGSDKIDNYRVVGFVDVLIYDLDIGHPPPKYPHLRTDQSSIGCNWNNLSEANNICRLLSLTGSEQYADLAGPMDWPMGWPPSPSIKGPFWNTLATAETTQFQQWTPAYPYGFTLDNTPDYREIPYFAIDNKPEPCNLARARISCNSNLIISFDSEAQVVERKVVLKK